MNKVCKLVLVLLAGTALSACQDEEQKAATEPRPVLSVVAIAEPAVKLALPGIVEARIETEFGFRILGRVVARNVQTGDLVKKGDVLAAIDPLALELAVKSAQSDLANSEAQLANAITTEERQKTLFERQSGAKAAYETAQLERKTAEAAVAKAKANLAKANEQLGYAQLVAEFDGVVTSTSAEIGQVVSPGQTIATVARPEERDAVIDAPETAGKLLQPGSVFDVSLQLDPSVRARGIVREIAPEADAATRTFRTRLTLVEPPEVMRLGSVVTATATNGGEPAIRLPASAIRTDGAAHSVWIVDVSAAKVALRPVTIDGDPSAGGPVTILSGVEPGDRIVTAGVNTLEEGQSIRVDQEMTK
ncbi:efflux RND transporter periplasmic adaptor subunit [Ciceribacter sp. L1K23]|uniref:efflux RND transporter periplasmic adaptor subunit n=1 Tax=Ciceribacter sp. L1K23 TaxID=2820276 RepID=UPI001B82AB87|nr:efflux RND transporter periplasmic adaptor subunit [Ciceribacter sp. L1K23]MBR0555101.1 efflux RND transporter periplasmic adaptor subunit [Ciceribacter sp. L1K23]